MKACILLGNTREPSNTEALTKIFADELAAKGFEIRQIALREKNVQTCVGCDACHNIFETFGCVIKDDMQEIAMEILSSELIIFTSPIYTWMPTPSLKAVMDRIYAFTKYPEKADPFNLLKKQRFAMIATSGDKWETNCDLFDETVRRMANFAKLPYLGYFAASGLESGRIEKDIADGAKAFAEKCKESIKILGGIS